MSVIEPLLAEVSTELVKAWFRTVTGKLFTEEQVRNLSHSIAGTYLESWLPSPEREAKAHARIEEARAHILQASEIILGIQDELDSQANHLNKVIQEIEEKKKVAEHYAQLISVNEETYNAFRRELENVIRAELKKESEKGKRARQLVSAIIWMITLIAGAALGAYFIQIVNYFRNLLQF